MRARAESARHSALIGLAALIAAYVLAFVDRQILNLLVEPIKRDLQLSDVEMSLLQGLSFALFLSIGGLPIGRLIDTRPRPPLLGLGVALWSLATAGCGLARGYAALLLCRIGVGVGEAAMTPSAYSLIGDWFSARRQGLAMGLYSLGVYIGSGLALVLGGLIVKHLPETMVLPLLGRLHGWQTVFLLLAVPGLAVALWITALRDPVRSASARPEADGAETRAWFAARARPLILVNAAVACAAMAMYGLSAWAAAFFHRQYGLTPAEVGPRLGLIVMAAGSLGSLGAGLLGDRLAIARTDGRLIVLAAGSALALPFAIAMPLAASAEAAFHLAAPLIFFLTLAIGSGPATLQQVTPPPMRGVQHALAVLAVNLLGLGLGPTLVALMTDHVLGDESRLGTSLAVMLPLALAGSCGAALLARRPYRRLVAQGVA